MVVAKPEESSETYCIWIDKDVGDRKTIEDITLRAFTGIHEIKYKKLSQRTEKGEDTKFICRGKIRLVTVQNLPRFEHINHILSGENNVFYRRAVLKWMATSSFLADKLRYKCSRRIKRGSCLFYIYVP